MRKLSAEELVQNHQRVVSIVEETFTGDRKLNLLKLLEHFEERLVEAPASGKEHFHSTYPGGYNAHILNVYDISFKMFELYKQLGMTIDYTKEEITLCALFHDLGKVGDVTSEYYIPQESEWHKNNRGEIYKLNPQLMNMPVQDRSLYLLQHFGVQLTANEWLTIKIHDGLYDEGNKYYYIVWDADKQLRTNLPYLIHHSDMTATRLEYEQWKTKFWENQNGDEYIERDEKKPAKKYKSKATLAETLDSKKESIDLSKAFEELFK